MRNILNNYYTKSPDTLYNIILMRNKLNNKLCLKKKYKFIQFKTTPSILITNRIFTKGHFLKFYKTSKKFYNNFFLETILNTLPVDNDFLNMYNKYNAFKNFDWVLFWRLHQVDCYFNLKKEKNKLTKEFYVYYIKDQKRYLIILKWLKIIMYLNYKKKKNTIDLFKPLVNFLTETKDKNEINRLKLNVYRIKMVQQFCD